MSTPSSVIGHQPWPPAPEDVYAGPHPFVSLCPHEIAMRRTDGKFIILPPPKHGGTPLRVNVVREYLGEVAGVALYNARFGDECTGLPDPVDPDAIYVTSLPAYEAIVASSAHFGIEVARQDVFFRDKDGQITFTEGLVVPIGFKIKQTTADNGDTKRQKKIETDSD